MNWKRLCRFLVCLLVVCCLLFNMSPIQAEATGLEALAAPVVVATPGLNVVAAILIGLGVFAVASQVDWDGVARNCAEWLEDQGVIDAEGNCKIIRFTPPDPNGGVPKWAVAGSIIDQVRSWLFDEGILDESAPPDGFANYNGVILPDFSHVELGSPYDPAEYKAIVKSTTGYHLYTWYYPPYLAKSSLDSNSFMPNKDHANGIYCINFTFEDGQKRWDFALRTKYNSNSIKEGIIWTSWDVLDAEGNLIFPYTPPSTSSSVSTEYELNLGLVLPYSRPLHDYKTWTEGVITVPGSQVNSDDETVEYWPLGLGQNFQDTSQLTQEEIWTGDGELSPPRSETYPDSLGDTNAGIFLDGLVDAIIAPIKAIFVPSSDFITAKVQALRAEFGFADAIISTGEFIGTSLGDIQTEPPVIYIDLGASRGSYDLGGEVPFVDLRWYEEYKPAGDALLSAFMWAAFAWRMFVKAPGFISGMPGDFVMDGVNSLGMVDALPTRKKEYALQRQANRRLKDK